MQVTLEERQDTVPGPPCVSHLYKPQIILMSEDCLAQREAGIMKKLNSRFEEEGSPG